MVIASFLFYSIWDYRFLGLLVFVIIAAWFGTFLLARIEDKRWRKLILAISISVQIAVLAFFKYSVFAVNNLDGLLLWLGLSSWNTSLNIILPIGLSFYIFHSISLSVDFYSGKLERDTPSLIDVALYISFFPQLVSGPIVRSTVFMPQLETTRSIDLEKVQRAISLILVGYIYKLLLSDNIAGIIDPIFAEPTSWNRSSLWAANIGYYGQIYFDFSGYTNIAIGLSLLLGYDLPKNFDYPYGAANITDFWRRWHISLSNWLRDYLFIPLGGGRGKLGSYFRNIMITMLLGGLWHGASWNFVIWGALHGIGLTAHKIWLKTFSQNPIKQSAQATPLAWVAGLCITQLWILLLWLFFRIEDFGTAVHMIGRMFALATAGNRALTNDSWSALLLISFPLVIDTIIGCIFVRKQTFTYIGRLQFGLVAGAVAAFVVAAFVMQVRPFIYFKF